MLLACRGIAPRLDGTVIARDDEGKPYVFAPGANGVLFCDVPEDLAARLLAGGKFERVVDSVAVAPLATPPDKTPTELPRFEKPAKRPYVRRT